VLPEFITDFKYLVKKGMFMSFHDQQKYLFTYQIHSNEPDKVQFPNKDLVWSLFLKVDQKVVPVFLYHNFSEDLLKELITKKLRRVREIHRNKSMRESHSESSILTDECYKGSDVGEDVDVAVYQSSQSQTL
jgi:hypothetical protein